MRNDICLRPVSRERDRDNYIRLQKETSPFRHMFEDRAFCDKYWNDMFAEGRVPYAITETVHGEFCGGCAIMDVRQDRPELEMELLEKFRGCGIGYTALCILLRKADEEYGRRSFLCCIDADNYASQALAGKAGGRPAGLRPFFFASEEKRKAFEEKNRHMIDDRMRKTAKIFGTEPEKLLSHVLMYTIDGSYGTI